MQKDAWFYIQSTIVTVGIFGFFCLLAFGVLGTHFRGTKSLKFISKISIILGAIFMAISVVFLIFIASLMLNGGHL